MPLPREGKVYLLSKMPSITVFYNISSTFTLPKDVFLLSVEENRNVKGENVYGSWWVKWNVLHYYDKDGKECKVESDYGEPDLKHPNEQDTEIDFEEHAEEDE